MPTPCAVNGRVSGGVSVGLVRRSSAVGGGTMMDLEHVFKHHPPTPEKARLYVELRDAGLRFAKAIQILVPSGSDQVRALQHVRDAVMLANAGVALDGRLNYTPDFISRDPLADSVDAAAMATAVHKTLQIEEDMRRG
jgi:hypothetical protein